MLQCLQGTVEGRVQGVFFRDSMRRYATQVGATGWVRNLADGRVEWFICADEATMQLMLAWLQQGPPAAAVSAVRQEPAAIPDPAPSEFVIR